MQIIPKISRIFEYRVALDLDARLSRTQALIIILMFIGLICAMGFFVAKVLLQPDNQSVYQQKIAILEQESEKNNNLETQVELALAYYLQGNTEHAQGLFEELLRQDKENAAANIYYGMILADLKKYREAIPLLEKGLIKAPNREKLAYRYLGLSYYQTGNLGKALHYLKVSVALDPGSPLCDYYLGLVYKKQGDYRQAQLYLNKAVKMTAGNFPEAQKELRSLPTKFN